MDSMDHGKITVAFIGTNDMVAVILTNPLQGEKFKE